MPGHSGFGIDAIGKCLRAGVQHSVDRSSVTPAVVRRDSREERRERRRDRAQARDSIRLARIDEHHARDVAAIAIGVKPVVETRRLVSYEHERRHDARMRKERVQIVHVSDSVAGRRRRVAEAEAGGIIRADARPTCDQRLNIAPGDGALMSVGVEDDGRRTLAPKQSLGMRR